MLLIDGLSRREESSVSDQPLFSIGDVPLFGGSAGDGLDFGVTWVFAMAPSTPMPPSWH